jgi:hypothetical protein
MPALVNARLTTDNWSWVRASTAWSDHLMPPADRSANRVATPSASAASLS